MSIEGVPQNSNPAADSDDATQKTNIDVATEKFYKTVEKLPTDMASSWILKFEDLDSENELEKFFNEFDTFLQNRELALAGNSLEIHPEADARIREEVLKVHEYIKKTFGDPNYFLGNGATAEVYTLPIAPDLCTKYIHSQDAYNENNHMRKEYGFLDELHTFSHAGVRTPKPYFLRIHPSEGHSYGMERIEGENLSRILEEPSKNIELITLLKTLDRQRVEESLVSYVETMHKQFKITHNDLFKRNIMVDTEGNFYIIDFGKAKQQEIGEDHEVFQKSDIARTQSEVRSFFKKLDEIDIDDIVISDS